MNLDDMRDWEQEVHLAALEIAYMVVSGRLGDHACEHALELLDINGDEAGVLEQNLQAILEEESYTTIQEGE